MAREYPYLAAQLFNTPHAITPEKLAEIERLYLARVRNGHGNSDFEAVAPRQRPAAGEFIRSGDTAIIPIMGVIFERPSIMSSGGSSAQEIALAVDAAAADKSITSILLDVSSPGGSVFGIQETADRITAARSQKRVVAVANSFAASAAFWLASQASELIVTPGGQVGSIGVVAVHQDMVKMDETLGVKTTLVTAGRYKAETDPSQPLSADARNAIQDAVDKYYAMFTAAVARGRGTTSSAVQNGFGQGRMVLAADAVKQGMADRVGTLQSVLQSLNSRGSSSGGSYGAFSAERARRDRAADCVRIGLPTR